MNRDGTKAKSRWWVVGTLLFLLLAALPIGCVVMGPPSTKKAFSGRPTPESHTLDLPNGRRIRYLETGRADGPMVLFVHGTPGSATAFSFVMADPVLAARALLVSVDRLGWGGSEAGGLEPSMAAQADALRAVIRAHPNRRPVIVVGHSLGGPVASRLAMDSPDVVDGLVLVAPSIDPEMERTAWYQAVSRWAIIRWAVPGDLVRADHEIVPLKGELAAMVPKWSALRLPITVIQGMNDKLVPAENAAFAERVVTQAPLKVIRMVNQGHLIPWERPDVIRSAVMQQLDNPPQKESPKRQ